jgi:hypothetical protein
MRGGEIREMREKQAALTILFRISVRQATGVRKNEDYLKNYFISQYGAVADVDFSPIFESLLEGRKEV